MEKITEEYYVISKEELAKKLGIKGEIGFVSSRDDEVKLWCIKEE
jgi:hypothetical protein